ncbi:ABC transporter permease [Mesorhizobium amorphae]|uniref:ABC transporter permease n=1 Tax=Mesorhizobium amorphae TaxID=71433 RepID=UPI00177EA70F|nr:ABC transporter permease [Mesorhizobium amorphae]
MFRHSQIKIGHLYLALFLLYLLLPLGVMGGASLNDSRFPTVYPWMGLTDKWFIALWNDSRMWGALRNSVVVAIGVVLLAVPTGTAAAFVISSMSGTARTILYGALIAPVLAPGAVIGISTLLFWAKLSVPPGLHLSVLGQVSYIASLVMLLVLARLRSLDASLEEAAIDLGASHAQVLRYIVFPHLAPALTASAAVAFFQSMENFNITLFTRGTSSSDTLTVYVFSMVRGGVTPSINALALIIVSVTLLVTTTFALLRQSSKRP